LPFGRIYKCLLGAGAAGLAAVTVTTAVWVAHRGDAARAALSGQIRTLTGRDVTIQGGTEIRLLPRPTLKFARVTLHAAPGEPGPPLTAEEMRISLRLWPLLTGRFKLENMVLTRPVVRIALDETGRPNWAWPPVELGRAMPGLGRVALEHGTVFYSDARLGLRERLDGVAMALSWPNLGDAASLSAGADWRGAHFELSASADAPAAMLTGRSTPARLAVASTLVKASFDGRAGLKPRPEFEGEAAITAPVLRDVLRWAGRDLGPGGTLGALSLKGRVRLEDGLARMVVAPLELDGNRAEGALDLAYGGARPRFTGTLDFGKLDLTPYLAAEPGAPDFDPAVLSRLELDLRLSADSLLLGRFNLGQLAASATLRDGIFEAVIGDAEFYGGRIKGSVAVNPVQAGLRGQAKGLLTRFDAQKALAAAGGTARISGRGELSFALGGEGSSWPEMLRTLEGQAELKLRQGSLTGLPVPQARELPSGNTGFALSFAAAPYDLIETSVTFAHGEAHADRLLLDSPGLRLEGLGSVSLPSLGLALRARAVILKQGPGGERAAAFELPVSVTGTLGQPLLLAEEGEFKLPAALPSLRDAIRALRGPARDAAPVSPE
jgi:AsmA protein